MEIGKKYRCHNGSITWLCEALTSDKHYILTSPPNTPIILKNDYGWMQVKEPRKTGIYYIGIYEDIKGKLYVGNANHLYKPNIPNRWGNTKLVHIAEFQYIEPV